MGIIPPSIIDRLPSSLLLHILSYLNYVDLRKSVVYVNKRFNALIANPRLDNHLFRDSPTLAATYALTTSSFQLHPALRKVTWPAVFLNMNSICLRNENGLCVEGYDTVECPLFMTQIGKEHALSPSVYNVNLVINGHTSHLEASQGRHGVSVLDIMKGVIEAVEKGEPAVRDLQGKEKPKNEWAGIEKVEIMNGHVYLFIEFKSERFGRKGENKVVKKEKKETMPMEHLWEKVYEGKIDWEGLNIVFRYNK